MNDITKIAGRDVRIFDPAATSRLDAQFDAVIEYCKRVQDWPTLRVAVEAKIDEQVEFVGWWTHNIFHGGDRQSEKSKNAGRRSWSVDDVETNTGISQQQVSKWRRSLGDREGYAAKLYGAAYRKAMGEIDNHLANGTGENEWYTPALYIDAATEVLGGIDLDPASSVLAQRRIKAAKYYDADADGLAQPWTGRVWLNPPYATELIPKFVAKLVESYRCDDVPAAIMLTHSYTDTAWFHLAESQANAICFTRGRIGFESPQGEVASPTQGQAFFYYGPDVDVFAGRFGAFGFIR